MQSSGFAARLWMKVCFAAIIVIAFFALATPASGQCDMLGAFRQFAPSWTSSGGNSGHFFPAGGQTMMVDTNGNGIIGGTDPFDTTYTLPSVLQGTRFISVLSPTREFYVCVGGTAQGGCDANRTLRIYRLIPATSTMTLVHEDCLPCPVFQGPLYFDLGVVPPSTASGGVSPQRIVLIRTGGGTFCTQSNQSPPVLRWYDLNTPGASGRATTQLGLSPSTGTIMVSPSGYQAFFQHDLLPNAGDADYDLINICPGPNFGTIIQNEMGARINDFSQQPTPTPSVFAIDGAGVTLRMTGGPGSPVIFQATVPNCCTGGGAPMGACCVNGGCLQTTQANCAGTWSAGMSCANANCPPPPVPNLSISVAGPTQAYLRDYIDYTITYQNSGGAPASNVVVVDRVPNGASFVSAGQGGTFSSGSSEVTWNIGTLPANSGPQTVTLRVRAGCSFTFLSNGIFRISATAVGTINGSNSVLTAIGSNPNLGSATGSVTTSTTSQEPLLPGSILRHTFTVTNSGSIPLTECALRGYAGVSARFTAVIDQGAGAVTIQNNGYSMEWIGNLAIGQTTTIIMESTINECISASNTTTQLNLEQPWRVTTYCNEQIGTFPTTRTYDLAPPITAALVVQNVQPGVIGPVSAGSTTYPDPMQFVRGTPDLEFSLSLANHTGGDIPAADISLQLPSSWLTSPTPFLGTPPPGWSYDEQTNIVNYVGAVPAAGVPPVVFGSRPNAPISGTQYFDISRTIASSQCTVMVGSLNLANLPELPTGPFIMGVDKFFGGQVWTLRPGIDPLPVPYFNRTEVWHGIHKTPSGDVWLAGGPLFMFNAQTLTSHSALGAEQFLESLGLESTDATDIAVDPTDNTVVILAQGRVNSPNPALVRYNPATGSTSLITRDPAIAPTDFHGDLIIDPLGTIFIANRVNLARIPRSMSVPIANGSVPIVPVPQPAYSLAPDAGTLVPQSQHVHAATAGCDGKLVLLHASTFTGGTNPDGIAVETVLYALSTYDPATNTTSVFQPQLAANSDGQGPRTWPTAFSPQLPLYANLSDSCLAQGDGTQVIVGNDYYPFHSIYAVDTGTGAAAVIEPAEQWHLRSAADMVMFNALCGSSAACDSIDFNRDTLFPDTGDIDDFLTVFSGGPCSTDPAPGCGDVDFNNDGLFPDVLDIDSLISVFSGGPCLI